MEVVLLGLISVVVLATNVSADYHSEVGMDLASRIKAAEDKLFAQKQEEELARIVGGEIVSHNEHPYLAGLVINLNNYSNNMSVCGSCIITANRLLTAGHCIVYKKNVLVAKIEVVMGSQHLFYGGLRITTRHFKAYPDYNHNISEARHDIAMVYLPDLVEFSDNIQPIALAAPTTEPDSYVGKTVVAAGYGMTYDRQKLAHEGSDMQQVLLQVIPECICNRFYGINAPLGTIICTSGDGGVGTCHGDSGGPLVLIENGRKKLIGVTAFGDVRGCELGHPGGFTRITSFMDFILSNIL